jgi:MFS transporter, NNP family, nitrate/nitrite transporter
VNLAFRQSFLTYGSADAAYLVFIAFYALCVAVTWAVYLRPAPIPASILELWLARNRTQRS